MKRMIKIIASIALLCFSVFQIHSEEIGKFSLVIGSVQVKENGKLSNAKAGLMVNTGMEITTGFKGKAVLQLNTGTQLKINNNTVLKMSSFSKGSYGSATDIDLKTGGVRAIVQKLDGDQKNHFRIRTPTAVAGVRGTDEFVSFSPNRGTMIFLHESSAEMYGMHGFSTVVPEGGGAGSTEGSHQMLTPDQMKDQNSQVFFLDPSMSPAEMMAVFEAFDPTFGGSAADFDFLFDLFEQNFFFNDPQVVTIELL